MFSSSGAFPISANGKSGPSLFLFSTLEGTIAGWNPHVDFAHAVVAVDNSGVRGIGPVYTGLALASNAEGTFLYAANFRAGRIDVFDANYHAVSAPGASDGCAKRAEQSARTRRSLHDGASHHFGSLYSQLNGKKTLMPSWAWTLLVSGL